MKKVKIIGVSGKIGSGKDTFAEQLARLLDTNVEKYAFADKLRETTQLITGVQMSEVINHPFYNKIYTYTHEQKDMYLPLWGKTIGECLQIIGTDAMRNGFDYEVWVKSLFETSGKECLSRGHIMVIADVRFPNEADNILARGGIVVRMEGDPMNVRANSTRGLNHISETALDDYKCFSKIITNTEPDIGLLRNEIVKIIHEFNIG